MALIKKDTFENLGAHHAPHCYSIYIPTQRYGQEVLEGKDAIAFKKALASTRDGLRSEGLSDRAVDELLAPARALLADSGFWRRLSDGLAVFGSNAGFWHYELPLSFRPRHYLADHFYVLPLMPMFNGDGHFFVLQLSLKGARFYEGTRHTLTEVYVEDLTPARLEEVVGYDYEERTLQFRTQAGGAQFHGHAGADNKRKQEILQYFRAVDKGLAEILRDQRDPLLVSCLDFQFPIYREANTYGHLLDQHLKGSSAGEDMGLLHERAWAQLAPHFDAPRAERLRAYQDLSATDRTSIDLEPIVAGAVNGRIDTLFLDPEAEAWGLYRPADGKLLRQEAKDFANASLTNLAAVHTFRQGGQVFLLDGEDLPVPGRPMNALFRY